MPDKPISTLEDNENEVDLLALVTGNVLRDTKKNLREQKQLRLIDGKRYGFLTLNKEDSQGSGSIKKYQCKCDCGGEVYLDRPTIQGRARMRAGCFLDNCKYGPNEAKAWFNPYEALRIQLLALLRICPGNVDPRWGGKGYGLTEGLSFEEGLQNLYGDLRLIVKRDHCWWLTKQNPVLPYAAFNIKVVDTPQFNVFGGKARYIMFGDILYTIKDITQIYNLDENELKKWRRALVDDHLLMEKVMRNQNK